MMNIKRTAEDAAAGEDPDALACAWLPGILGSGAHVAEARERLAALDEQARKDADEKAWADAQRTGTTAAFNDYVQKFPSDTHGAEARQRIAALDEQARKEEDEKAWAEAQRSGTAA